MQSVSTSPDWITSAAIDGHRYVDSEQDEEGYKQPGRSPSRDRAGLIPPQVPPLLGFGRHFDIIRFVSFRDQGAPARVRRPFT